MIQLTTDSICRTVFTRHDGYGAGAGDDGLILVDLTRIPARVDTLRIAHLFE